MSDGADEDRRGAEGGDRGGAEEIRDWTPEELRENARRVVDEVVAYLAGVDDRPVLPGTRPGDVRDRIPGAAPERPETLDAILADVRELIVPNLTHWQHRGFMAYFPSTACGPGIAGEWMAAALNSNVMLWRNAPASTELEERMVEWLRELLGLPDEFRGMFTDTASISSLLALAAARHSVSGWDWRARGLNHPDAPRLRMYRSEEAHSSIDKAATTLGVGLDAVRVIPTDERFAMRPDALRERLHEDRLEGSTPFAVVATVGTTSSTAVDPVAEIAEICHEHGLWLHVDAAYAGAAACLPELRHHFSGWEFADSIVFNPHKWFFTPFDASLLLFRDPARFRDAFRVVPEYLRTDVDGVTNFNEYGVQLGRRFRALKIWFQLRSFGADGMRAMLRGHVELARWLAAEVDRDPDFVRVGEARFATVCLRYEGTDRTRDPEELDRLNERIVQRVNAAGRYFLSHTRLRGRFVIRVAIGNPRQTWADVRGCFDALREASRAG